MSAMADRSSAVTRDIERGFLSVWATLFVRCITPLALKALFLVFPSKVRESLNPKMLRDVSARAGLTYSLDLTGKWI